VTRQCVGCGIVLPPEGRSPHCERCRLDYQRQRNREKVWAFRARVREAGASQAAAQGSRSPSDEELTWLDAINLGLEEPIRRVHELLDSGRSTSDSEVIALAAGALRRYDALRDEFEAQVSEDSAALAASWRGYFESVRRALG
jgi:hypothetical protein